MKIISIVLSIAILLLGCSSASNDVGGAGGEGEIVVTDAVAPDTDQSLPFGNITVNSTADLTITVSNSGSGDLVLGSIAAVDALEAPFSLQQDNCSSQTLSPAANCSLTIRFAPTAVGPFTDSFDIPSNDADESTITINVSGTGDPVPVPNISISDSVAPGGDLLIAFGNIMVGNNADQDITISNTGSANLVMGNLAVSNPLQAPFSILANTCSGQTIAPNSNCSVTIRYSPSESVSSSDSLDIPSNDPDQATISFNVNGTGTPQPSPNISVSDDVPPIADLQIPFGTALVGQSLSRNVVISNSGNANLVMGNIGSPNPLAVPFEFSLDNCSGQTIPTGGNCQLTINFATKAAGSFNDAFNIPSNDPNDANIIFNVSATGLPQRIYVDATQTGQGDGSAANPYANIQTAIDNAVAGQAVRVLAGTYSENIVMKSGVDVIGAGATVSIISGDSIVTGVVRIPEGTDDVTIKGFTVTVHTPKPGYDRGLVIGGGGSNIIVERNVITGVQYGMFVGNSPALIRNNTFVSDNDEQGIYLSGPIVTATIQNNIIIGYNWGIHRPQSVTGNPTLLYNDVFNNNVNYQNLKDPTDVNGNISANPLLGINFQPSLRSPVIDTGDPTSPNDPDGTRANIGVF